MSTKQQAKVKGGKAGLTAVAMMLIAQGQQAISTGSNKMGAGLLIAGAALLLGYEYISDKGSEALNIQG